MARSLQRGDLTICRVGLGANRIKNIPEAYHIGPSEKYKKRNPLTK